MNQQHIENMNVPSDPDNNFEKPNICSCKRCNNPTLASRDLFCENCFFKRKVIYVVVTLLFVVGIHVLSCVVGAIAEGHFAAIGYSVAQRTSTSEIVARFAEAFLWIAYKIAMTRYLRSSLAFTPLLVFIILYKKSPQKEKRYSSNKYNLRADLK